MNDNQNALGSFVSLAHFCLAPPPPPHSQWEFVKRRRFLRTILLATPWIKPQNSLWKWAAKQASERASMEWENGNETSFIISGTTVLECALSRWVWKDYCRAPAQVYGCSHNKTTHKNANQNSFGQIKAESLTKIIGSPKFVCCALLVQVQNHISSTKKKRRTFVIFIGNLKTLSVNCRWAFLWWAYVICGREKSMESLGHFNSFCHRTNCLIPFG